MQLSLCVSAHGGGDQCMVSALKRFFLKLRTVFSFLKVLGRGFVSEKL